MPFSLSQEPWAGLGTSGELQLLCVSRRSPHPGLYQLDEATQSRQRKGPTFPSPVSQRKVPGEGLLYSIFATVV